MRASHAFSGANSPLGFYSYFHEILDLKTANMVIYLKGGPGTGKSSLMKRLGKEFSGRRLEYYHCSSDCNSLDGLHIADAACLIVDATAPHTLDPVYPGAVDRIVNLGEFWRDGALRGHRDEIIRLSDEKKQSFAQCYNYLSAAASMDRGISGLFSDDLPGYECDADELLRELLPYSRSCERTGRLRRLFASAITPDGYVNYLDTLLTGRVYSISCEYGAHLILVRIMDGLLSAGYDVNAYYCPLSPNRRLEHLTIPELGVSFTTQNAYHSVERADISLNPDRSHEFSENKLRFFKQARDFMMNNAVECLKKAREIHQQIEAIYIPCMDFDRIDAVFEKIVNEINC